MTTLRRNRFSALAFALCLGTIASASGESPDAEADFFNGMVHPLLESKCFDCHGEKKSKGGLRLHTLETLLKGGDSGPAIVPGEPGESLLVERISLPPGHDDIMPSKGDPLTNDEIGVLRKWVHDGAHWPAKPQKEDTHGLRSLSIYPPEISLETNRDFNRFVVVATFEDDTTYEVTSRANIRLGEEGIADLEGTLLRPVSDGETQLNVSFHGLAASAPLTVQEAQNSRPVSFRLDVMPVFMRSGCNSGSCHGAARGKDGFMLSLFGYDPAGDYHRITREFSTRRINLARPAQSMLITKPLEGVPHSGGKLFDEESDYCRTLLQWLEAGARDDPNDIAEPVSLGIFPNQALLEGNGTQQQFIARAKYSDGTDRDVTSLALFESNNGPTAKVSKDGLVIAGTRGEAFVMARFATFTVGSQIIVIPKNLDYERPAPPEYNYIDRLVHEKLHKLRIIPSGLCSDEVFLRRASLDITGLLPKEEEHRKFVSNPDPKKREALVDELLSRKEFTELWLLKWAELLQIRTNPGNRVSYKATLLYYNWLQERVAANVPFNKIVQELLSSTGGTFTNPATNYYQIERDPLKLTENLAQVFLGMRLQCAQCHNHPFDRWTMNDYYGLAAFFSQIGRKGAEDPREVVVFNRGGGDMRHPVGNRIMKPKFLGSGEPELKNGDDRRKKLAEWLASPDNPFFSKNLANIIWEHFSGVGIIDPVDDVRVSNPASNPELLDELARRFTDYNYDFKRLVRDICTSKTYQLSTRGNESNRGDLRNYSHASIRRMRAEVLLDALSQVTETQNKFRGLPQGARAVQIADGNVSNYFLKTFGRAERKTVCSCEVKVEPNLGQALHLINGEVTGNRIRRGKVVQRMLEEEKKPPAEIIEALYVRTLCREPTEKERSKLIAAVGEDPKNPRDTLEDIFWALLNSKEFMFNH